jgi:hypothetical protein
VLIRAVHEAGASSLLASGRRLGELVDVVTPLASIDDVVPSVSGPAVRLVSVARNAAQARLRNLAEAGATTLQLDVERCTAVDEVCGFEAGLLVSVFDDGGAALVTIIGSNALGVIAFTPPLPRDYGPGSGVTAIDRTTFGMRDEGDGTATLVRRSAGGAEQPVLRHVVSFEAAEPTPSRLTVRLRVEAAADALRGPAGLLFHRAGTAQAATQWVPDLELRTTITLRNMAP